MAPGQTPTPDFNAIIQAGRERRKAQDLAQEIFSKNRRASAPGAGIPNRRPAIGGSLASRIGVQKRTASTARASPRPAGNVNSEWTHDLHSVNNPSSSRNLLPNPPRGPRAGRTTQGDRLRNALNNTASSPALNSQFNIVGNSKSAGGMSIRGLAGPYLVIAKNLAPGTTTADIESAMTPVGGVVVSCVIIAEKPMVIAEVLFETKEGADNVVDTFNNQNADGNILIVYHKAGPISSAHKLQRTPAPRASAVRAVTPLGPRAGTGRGDYRDNSDTHRGRSRERPRDNNSRDYGRDDVQDGTYGFDDRMETDNDSAEKGRGLYSDTLINSNRGRGGGNNRDQGRGNGYQRGRDYR